MVLVVEADLFKSRTHLPSLPSAPLGLMILDFEYPRAGSCLWDHSLEGDLLPVDPCFRA